MKSKFSTLVESVIASNELKLILIRGLSGSGKTTYARKLMAEDPNLSHYEADMYFYDADGKYAFNPKLLPKAHAWCKDQTEKDLRNGKSVIVSNTFTQKWEIAPYIELGKQYGAKVVIKKATGTYKNVHGVPDDAVAKMKSRWEDVEGEDSL
jgi:predicted kinase